MTTQYRDVTHRNVLGRGKSREDFESAQMELDFEGVNVKVELLLTEQLRLFVSCVPHITRHVHQDRHVSCFLQSKRFLSSLCNETLQCLA